MKIKVGVFFGSRSVEHEVSIVTAHQVINALDQDRFEVIPVYISKTGQWYSGTALKNIDNFKNLDLLLTKCQKLHLSPNYGEGKLIHADYKFLGKPQEIFIDVAFPVFHGTNGEDGTFQGMMEILGLPYVGSDVLGSSLTMDKIISKQLFKEAGLPIIDYYWFNDYEWLDAKEKKLSEIEKLLSYPVIVKPNNLGSSIGVKRCNDRNSLSAAIDTAATMSSKIIIEQLVPSLKEINCSVLGEGDSIQLSVCEELIFESEIQSFENKYMQGAGTKGMSASKRIIPADIAKTMTEKIETLSKKVFKLLRCSGVVRIDYMLDQKSSMLYVNEVNPLPGSFSFYLWEPQGKTFTALTSELIDIALKKKRTQDKFVNTFKSNILANQSSKGMKGLKVK